MDAAYFPSIQPASCRALYGVSGPIFLQSSKRPPRRIANCARWRRRVSLRGELGAWSMTPSRAAKHWKQVRKRRSRSPRAVLIGAYKPSKHGAPLEPSIGGDNGSIRPLLLLPNRSSTVLSPLYTQRTSNNSR